MKRLLRVTLAMLLLVSGSIEAWAGGPRKSWSAADGVFYLLTKDGGEEYTVDGSITFKAVADGSTIQSYRDCGVVFSPANEGDVLQITVNSIDLSGSNYLLLYDGAVEKIGVSDYSRTGAQSKYLPDGWVKWYTSESVGETYTSTSPDGKLSFGFHSQSVAGQTGFNITVTSFSPKDMEFGSVSAIADLGAVNRGAADQAIFGVNVNMDGGGNPMTMDELKIDASALTGSTQVTNVRLYKGTAFTADNLLATAATVGDELVATNVTLKGGDNKFMVVADITESAKGSIPSLEVTSVKIAGESRAITAATGQAVDINNVILMPAEAKTYVIDDDAAFYDDGGKDGKISLNFTGQVTFVPATEGNAIKVDFTKLALFNTSSVGKNDVLKFYNGRTADDANLITDLTGTTETSKVVKSTAADGSMTITLASTTGVPTDGWEAVVSQFLPGDMTFKSVNAQAVNGNKVAAGDADVQLLVVDVLTDNQSNPLNVTGFSFNSTDVKNIDKVRVYYLGEKNTFATTNVFGEAVPTTGDIAVSGEQALAEGHNYFAVVADVKTSALNGETIALSFTGATVAGEARTPESAVTATREVENVCRAAKGSHSHVISDAWTFLNAKGYSGKYEADGDADYIVTFTPAEAGTVAQIDFEKFDVYYASSSYSTRAVFEIYSGSEVNNANLLWQLQDAAQASTGPGKVIRSTAADGSMTIRFNPKTSNSYYAATGWEATVSPFKNHDMTIEGVTVNQTSSDVLAAGATDAALIDFEVETEGTLSLKTIKDIKLNLKDSQDAVSKVSVYYNNENNRSGAVLFGSVENPATADVTVSGERELAEASNYFWVTVDVKNDAAAETAVDAKLVSLTDAAGTVTIVENGDPEGARVVKYIYNFQADDNSVITVTNPLMFYDDGGAEGKVTARIKGNVTFVPGRENAAIHIDAKSFSIGNGYMYVYSGREVNADNLLGKTTGYGTTTGPANLISKAADGSLTIRYEGGTGTTLNGWAIEVDLHEKTPFEVDSLLITPTNATVNRNTVDALMQQVQVSVVGDKDPLTITNLKFDATGTTAVSDVQAVKVYYTGVTANFSNENCVATASGLVNGENVITFDQPVVISDNGDYYLWLTYDINGEAATGNKVAAAVTGVTVAESEIVPEGEGAEREIVTGLKGRYIIGASDAADYKSFAEASAALANGVEGAVTFVVEDGEYAENIKVQNVAGAGANNPITFESLNGDAAKVVLKGSGVVDQTYGAHKEGLFMIENTPYVTLRNMSIVPQSQNYPYAIHLYNQSRHATIDGMVVTATPVTSGSSGMSLVKMEAVNEDGKNNDYCTIQNSNFYGGYISLYLGGTNYVSLTREKGLIVRDNTIAEAGSKGIYIYDEDDCEVIGNTVINSAGQKSSYWGIDVARSHRMVIAANVIQNTHSYYSGGVYLRLQCADIDLYNNAITITNSPSNSSSAIQIDATDKYINVYYNSVRMAGNNGGGYVYYTANATSNASYEGIKVQNNLFQNLTTANAMFIHANFMGKAAFVNNAFYTANTNGYLLTDTDLAGLNALEGCSGNFIEQADFMSETDLQLKSAGNLNAALPIAGITTDLKGVERNATTPTIGAYEYVEVIAVTPEVAEGYPVLTAADKTTATLKTKWNVSGKLYAKVEKQTAASPAPRRKAPAAADILAETPVDVTADTEVTTTFDELDANTAYKAYFLLVSAIDDAQSNIVESDVFTTAPETLAIDLTNPFDVVNSGESTTLEATVTGGLTPYTYEWRDQMNQVVSNEATATVTPPYTYGYKLTVTSADGQTASAKTGVYVLGEAVTATLDDNYLPAESYFDGDNADDVFYSGSYAFRLGNPGGWWYGYGLSNQTSTASSGWTEQYNSAVGSGNNGSSNYCIAYPDSYAMSDISVDITNNLEGDVLQGMYITNSAYAYWSMMNGDAIAKKFEHGDWFKVTITGYDANGDVTGTVDAYLADLTHDNEADDYILNSWIWVDLSTLGTVARVKFALSSSDNGRFGMNTPGYLCIDDFNSPNPNGTTGVNKPSVGAQIESVTYVNLAGVVSDRPFDGVNIVVTRYTDGTQTSFKMVKN